MRRKYWRNDLSFTAEDGLIRKACGYILSYKEIGFYHRIFNDPSVGPEYAKCGICGRFFQRRAAFGKVGLESKPVRVMREWLEGMHRPDEGHFSYTCKPVSQFSRRKDGMDSRVAKYRLYYLIEDDRLTYYAARIGAESSSPLDGSRASARRESRGGNGASRNHKLIKFDIPYLIGYVH